MKVGAVCILSASVYPQDGKYFINSQDLNQVSTPGLCDLGEVSHPLWALGFLCLAGRGAWLVMDSSPSPWPKVQVGGRLALSPAADSAPQCLLS